jgi:hypothetical protein
VVAVESMWVTDISSLLYLVEFAARGCVVGVIC